MTDPLPLRRPPGPPPRPGPHARHWPTGVDPLPALPHTTLPACLARTAAQVPDKPAIVFAGSVTRYAALAARVDALAGFLQQRLGVAVGDRVLLLGQNGPHWVTACQAVLRAGAVVVPASPMSKPAELAHQASDSGARVALVARGLLAGVRPLVDAAVVFEDGQGDGHNEGHNEGHRDGARALHATAPHATPPHDPAQHDPAPHDPGLHALEAAIALALRPGPMPADPDALAALPYTSGTTGAPKGCRHSHASLLASLATSAVWKRLHRDSVVLTVAPLFHMLGLQNGMNLPLLLGATAVMMPRWHAPTAAALIERHRVTAWSAPPAMVIDLFNDPATAQRDLSSLVFLSGGGAAMPAAVATLLKEGHGLTYEEGYGLTETASFLHGNPPARCKPQCLGVPTQWVDSRIVDPATLQELPPGEVGELVTRAPQLMQGYWRNEAADRAAFITLDGQRYFRTGDLARVDEDGYFFMKDRLKRMINVSGYKVWPAEVESALYAHPAVHEACVIAVPDDRPGRCGEAVKALVVLKPGWAGRLDAAAFIAWCREQMAVYKAPRSVEFVPDLPKSGTGKLLWRELQQAHQARAGPATRPATPPAGPATPPQEQRP